MQVSMIYASMIGKFLRCTKDDLSPDTFVVRCNLLTQYSSRANSSLGSMFVRETNGIDISNFRIISRPLARDNTSEIKIERHSLEIRMDSSRLSILSLSLSLSKNRRSHSFVS